MSGRARLEQHCRFRVNRGKFLRQYDTVFRQPIRDGHDAPAVGNGDLAAIVWQPDHLTWMLNKCDLSGEASQAARLTFRTAHPLADRIGGLETRLSLADATVSVAYTGGKLKEGGTFSTPGHPVRGAWRGAHGSIPCQRPGDLGTLAVTGYVPFGRNALLIDYAEKPDASTPTLVVMERWVQSPVGAGVAGASNDQDFAWGDDLKADVRDSVLSLTYALKSGVTFAVALVYDGFPGAVAEKTGPYQATLTLPAAPETKGRLAVAVVTSHEAADPRAEAVRLARETLAADPATLRREHGRAWREFWERSFVDCGHPYANALHHASLYQLGTTSRGRRPVKFNGALNLWNERCRDWGEGYTIHNQHSVYLPLYATNHLDLAENFLDWIARVRPETIRTAQRLYGIGGAFYPECMAHEFTVAEALKFTGPNREYPLAYILSSGTRMARLMWNRYLYTLDVEFLREKAYPVIRDVAEFYINYGKLGPDGLYHVEPCLSWEERPIGRDGHADCAAWRAIFAMAIKASATLGVDREKVKVWRERLRKAPPYPVKDGVFSVVMREDGTPEPPEHFQWQLPNLSAVYPYEVLDRQSPAAWRRIAEQTFERYRYNADAGHEYLPVIAARLGNADGWRAALYQFIQFFQAFDQGAFDYFNIAGNKAETVPQQRELLYTYLEASGIFATAVNEMLLQSHGGLVSVFPAMPPRWHGRFILRAAGSLMVASEHRGSEGVPYILIQPVGGAARTCQVLIPWPQGASVVCDGRKVAGPMKGKRLTFDLEPGKVYALTPKGKRLRDVPVVDIEPRADCSPSRLGMVWYGSREGANCHTGTFPIW